MLGALYAVLAAASFGLNNASSRRGVISGSAVQGIVTAIPLGLLMFIPAVMIAGEMDKWAAFSWLQILYLAGGGFMHFIWGRYFNIRSLGAIGTNLSGPVQQCQHPIALFLAILLLHESLTPAKVLGILLIAAGPVVLIRSRRPGKVLAPQPVGNDLAEVVPLTAKPIFQPRMAEGYFCAFMAGIGFGTSPILISAGIGDSGFSMLAGMISFIAATIMILFLLLLPGQWRDVRNMHRSNVPWFLLAALTTFGSQFFRYLALSLAPVTVVQPIQSLSLMFRTLFGYMLNREHERLDRSVFVALGLGTLGALVLASGDALTRHYLPTLPDWLLAAATWTWP